MRLLEALLAIGPLGGTREHVVHRAEISTSSFYRVLEPLLEKGIVLEEAGRIRLPLENPYNYRFKLWHDMDRLYRLPARDRSEVESVLTTVERELGEELLALWLVGSAALGHLRSESDFDFVAVLRSERHHLYTPRATRDVNFVTFTREEFRQQWQLGDDFLQAAVRFGLVLVDRGFAQEFCASPGRPQPAWPYLHGKIEILGDLGERFFFFLKAGEPQEAARVLRSKAVTAARLMLLQLGELISGKADLLSACDLYFGHQFRGTLEACLQAGPDKRELVTLHRRIETLYQRFEEVAHHLSDVTRLAGARPREFEASVFQILTEILEPCSERESQAKPWVVACKTTVGAFPARVLREVGERMRDIEAGARLLVVNPWRYIPLRERPAFPEEVVVEAREQGLHLLTAQTLIQAHHEWHLEGPQAREVEGLRQLLGPPSSLLAA